MDAGAPAAPKGHSYKRRPHKKSRTGCGECRRRRVKCTEEKPVCASCLRHGEDCRYPDPRQTAVKGSRLASPIGRTPVSATTTTRTATTTPAPPDGDGPREGAVSFYDSDAVSAAGETFTMVDLALLHHWTASTSRSLVRSPEIDRIWQVVLPQVAFSRPFVMHALMSLAALHLAHLDRPRRRAHTIDAVRHHNQALRGFRETIDRLHEADADVADAVFACAAVNMIYVFGVSGGPSSSLEGSGGVSDGDDARSHKARVLGSEWIPMVRGIRATLELVMERVSRGPLGGLLVLEDWGTVDPDRDATPEDGRFRAMRTAWAGSDDAALYDETLYAFRKCYLYVVRFRAGEEEDSDSSSSPTSRRDTGWLDRAWAGPLIFLFMAPLEYLQRLHQRHPAALVLYAHFGAALHNLKRFWFLDGWSRDIVGVVDDLLGDYWRPWTSWPREVVGLA